MPKIKKRTIPVTKYAAAPKATPQCHYTILRHPLKDAGKGTFHDGPVNAEILAVHNGVIATGPDITFEDLYVEIVNADHWFIRKNPGRYSVVSNVFGMSFTFLVMQDGSYHYGWLQWPAFLAGERKRGVNTL